MEMIRAFMLLIWTTVKLYFATPYTAILFIVAITELIIFKRRRK